EPLDGFGLLGHPDGAHAAFADLLHELVRTDARAGGFARRRWVLGIRKRSGRPLTPAALTHLSGEGGDRRLLQKSAGALVKPQQLLHLPAQFRLPGARLVQVGLALRGVFVLQGSDKDVPLGHGPPFREAAATQCGIRARIAQTFLTFRRWLGVDYRWA